MSFSPGRALLQDLLAQRTTQERGRELGEALSRLRLSPESLDKALREAHAVLQANYSGYGEGAPVPDVIVADDETEPYVAIRFPVPASPEEAARLSWELHSTMGDRQLNLPGVTLAFAPAQDRLRDAVA